MSDAGRKSFTDKATEAIKPESEKTYLESAKESVTNTVDNFVGSNTPDSQKSLGQTVADNAHQGKEDAKASVNESSGSITETAQEYVAAAKEQVGAAVNYVSGVVTGAAEGAKQVDSEKK